jgi:pimeloyl-ACP methyl ester carboxylesterase
MKERLKVSCFIIPAMILISFCASRDVVPSREIVPAPGMRTIRVPGASDSSVSMIDIDVYVPAKGQITADILVLPGWKYSRTRWHRETDLLKLADRYGYRCVFPEMNISCYESQYFPQTRDWMKWSLTPGGRWIREIFLPHMRENHGLFMPGGRNFLLGLSTGGRGVALVSLQNPGLFTAGAALSGDFNQLDMPRDNLMIGLYGPKGERWRVTDNPYRAASDGNWNMPIYIGHGGSDPVVPVEQSRRFAALLRKKYPGLKTAYSEAKGQGHDFGYWNSELERVFSFFENADR